MKFSEIAARLTGISTPVFGASWTPPEAEVTAAKRVITYLEDRRVLYQPAEMEQPSHCIDSVLGIRRFLTNELAKLDPNEPLAQNLQAMRAACRKFLNQLERLQAFDQVRYRRFSSGYIQNMGTYEVWIFCSALGDLRTSVGLHVALIAVRNGLDLEEDLAFILPGEFDDGGATDLNLF